MFADARDESFRLLMATDPLRVMPFNTTYRITFNLFANDRRDLRG